MNIWTMLTWLELVAMILRAFEAWKLRFISKPQKKSFNGMMASLILVNLNEMSKKQMGDCKGRFKAFATDPTITINNKGVNQFKI